MHTILYIHGMGGGGDSRIPNYLDKALGTEGVRVVVRTYDFDPPKGAAEIAAWVKELRPELIIGESLGAVQALRINGIPQLFVSPALGAPDLFYRFAWLTLLPGGSALLHYKYPVKKGDRQRLIFRFGPMRRYKAHWEAAKAAARQPGYRFAFFGRNDHFMKRGVVQISIWREMFGDSFQVYEGTHFMEEEFIDSLLIPKIRTVLGIGKMDGKA